VNEDKVWAKIVEESILLTGGNPIFDYQRRGTSDCNTVENELREIFGYGKEYDYITAIEEEEWADLELIEQQ
jgi:hypothetical protein